MWLLRFGVSCGFGFRLFAFASGLWLMVAALAVVGGLVCCSSCFGVVLRALDLCLVGGLCLRVVFGCFWCVCCLVLFCVGLV